MINEKEREIYAGENRFYLADDNIIQVSIKGVQDEKIAMEMKNAFYRILDMIEDQGNIFADNSQTGKPSPMARDIFQEMIEHEKVGKIAVFGMNPVARIIATFVTGVSKNKNIQIFKTKKEAFTWLKE